MKKLITLLLVIISINIYSQEQNITIGAGRLEGLLYNTKSGSIDTLAAPHTDSLGQFKIKNVSDPVEDLDAVNLRTFLTNGFYQPLDSIYVDSTATPPIVKYTMFADTANRTVSLNLGNGVVLQIGQESLIEVYNNSGALIEDGKVLYGTGINGNAITVAKADNSGRYTALILSTEAIANGAYGFAVELAGKARGLNTSGISVGQIFLDEVAGELTNDRGVFPNYNYPLGACLVSDAVNGVIQFRSDGIDFNNVTRNAFNGSFNELFDFTTSSNGTVITGSLEQKGGGDLTMRFSDGSFDLDCTPALTVTLTAGTDANEQENFVYIDKTTKTIAVSTSGWPATEHIPVGQLSLQSAATMQLRGIARNQNINNGLAENNNLMGKFDVMAKKLRSNPAKFEKGSGADITVVGSGTTNVYFTTTAAQAWQMRLQSFDAKDVSTDYIIVPNDFTSAGTWVNDLTSITTDASGNSLNNKSFSVVIGGIQNSTTEPDQLYMMMPTGTYNNASDAIDDNSQYSQLTVPDNYDGVGFLLYRLTFSASSAATIWTLEDTEDLRGLFANTTARVGGTGGGGITTFLGATDTPSSYVGQGGKYVGVASGETALEFTSPLWTDATTHIYNTGNISIGKTSNDGRRFEVESAEGSFAAQVYNSNAATGFGLKVQGGGGGVLNSKISSYYDQSGTLKAEIRADGMFVTKDMTSQLNTIPAGYSGFYSKNDSAYFIDESENEFNLMEGAAASSPTFANISTNSSTLSDYTTTLATGVDKEWRDATNLLMWRMNEDDANYLLEGGDIYATRYRLNGTNTIYLDSDGSNNMTFTDAVTGTKTLAQLAAGGASFGSQYQIPVTNATTNDYDYFTAFTYQSSRLYTPSIQLNTVYDQSSNQIATLSSDQWVFNKQAIFANLSSSPGLSTQGAVYWNTTDSDIKYNNGSAFVSLTRGTVQSLSLNATSMNVKLGRKATVTISSSVTITLSNLGDGGEGTIVVTQSGGSGSVTLAHSGLTAKKMGSNSDINTTASSITKIVYERIGSNLYYGYIYEN